MMGFSRYLIMVDTSCSSIQPVFAATGQQAADDLVQVVLCRTYLSCDLEGAIANAGYDALLSLQGLSVP